MKVGFRSRGAALASVVGLLAITFQTSLVGSTNEWTKPTSGYWEEPYWSLGMLPSMQDDAVLFQNDGYKALAIGSSTTANYPGSLSIRNLGVYRANNLLLLNYAGLNVPLNIASDFILGNDASLLSYYSSLVAANFYCAGHATFAELSVASLSNIQVGLSSANAELIISNATLSSGSATVGSGLGVYGTINQVSGVHSNSATITLWGAERTGHHNVQGVYSLSDGFLTTPQLNVFGGSFGQSGGTNLAGDIALDFFGAYGLGGGSLECSNLNFVSANGSVQTYTPCLFMHSNGVNTVRNQLIINPPSDQYFCCFTRGGLYQFDAGTLNSHFVDVGDQFVHSGGLHNNDQIVEVHGRYTLSGGALDSPQLFVDGKGVFTQTGGTNSPQSLFIDQRAAFNLNAGTLSTSNTTVSGGDRSMPATNRASFTQSGGTHVVQNAVTVDGIFHLNGGTLSAPSLTINPDGDLWLAGGIFNNSDRFTMWDGVCYAQGQYPNLGKLSVQLGLLSRTTNANVTTLDLLNGSTVLRFKDSHDTASEWNGRLAIWNWSGSTNGGGTDQVYVGTTAQGLTPAQLQRISFLNPDGLPAGTYPARILATGEVVPSNGSSLTFSRTPQGMVLTWSGNYQLWTTTNLVSPWTLITGATSPYTNSFTDPQRYFKLRSSTP